VRPSEPLRTLLRIEAVIKSEVLKSLSKQENATNTIPFTDFQKLKKRGLAPKCIKKEKSR
jgi:hypothetical protein